MNPHDSESVIARLPRLRTLAMVAVVAAALAACGGGSSSASNSAASSSGTGTGTGGATAPSTDTIAPLPSGSGITTFSFGTVGEFVHVDATTGAVTRLSNPCSTTDQGFTALDARPDGRVVAVASDLYLVDVQSGACQKLMTAPQALRLVAVAADGSMYTIADAPDADGRFVMIVFDAAGTSVLAQHALTGANLGFVKGIDFGPDGTLYLSAHDEGIGYQVFTVDPATGALAAKFPTHNLAGDIDVDANGRLRSNGVDQTVYTIDVATGAVLQALPTDRLTERLMVYR